MLHDDGHHRFGSAIVSWWRHQMETFSALLAICAGNHRSPVNSTHKGQWRGALMFSLICAWINVWENNRKVGNLRRYRTHYDVIVMLLYPGTMFYTTFNWWYGVSVLNIVERIDRSRMWVQCILHGTAKLSVRAWQVPIRHMGCEGHLCRIVEIYYTAMSKKYHHSVVNITMICKAICLLYKTRIINKTWSKYINVMVWLIFFLTTWLLPLIH